MHVAARDGHADIAEVLIKGYKRLVKMRNKEGKSALSYALYYKWDDVAAIIRKNDGTIIKTDIDQKIKDYAHRLAEEPPDYRLS